MYLFERCDTSIIDKYRVLGFINKRLYQEVLRNGNSIWDIYDIVLKM